MGGFCALSPGSKSHGEVSPRGNWGTSSGAAETIMTAHAVHHILGQRILDKELEIHTGGPTNLDTDNLATLQGHADGKCASGPAVLGGEAGGFAAGRDRGENHASCVC